MNVRFNNKTIKQNKHFKIIKAGSFLFVRIFIPINMNQVIDLKSKSFGFWDFDHHDYICRLFINKPSDTRKKLLKFKIWIVIEGKGQSKPLCAFSHGGNNNLGKKVVCVENLKTTIHTERLFVRVNHKNELYFSIISFQK